MTTTSVRRNVFLLASCQALFMTSTSAIISTAPIVGGILLVDDKSLATLPLALQFVAMALTTIPASLYMGRFGRKVGFITGASIGACGGALGAYAIMQGDFVLFCIASLLTGSFNGFCHYFRFAAADVSTDAFRSKAISYVLAGSIVAALLGPTLARNTADLMSVQFAGVYLALIVVYLLVACIVSFIDIPRPTVEQRKAGGRPLSNIARQPKFIIAVCAATFGYLVMSFLMTVTPIAMGVCGFTFSDSSYVIQAHILGMYAPAFVTGHLINRFGVNNILIAGSVLCGASIVIHLSGIGFMNFLFGLVLVGVGWNFLFTGGTTLLTQTYTPAEKAKVQGLNDFFIWGTISIGAVTSGAVQHSVGWSAVNLVMAPLVLVVFATTLWLRFSGRKAAAEKSAA
ncbi:MAG: MFS transporter [Alphaproteobacteria bacterium]|nr:MFS transporter [Alphaproteobacteria bacterium]